MTTATTECQTERPPLWQSAITLAEFEPALRGWIDRARADFHALPLDDRDGLRGHLLAEDIEAGYAIWAIWQASEGEIARHIDFLRKQTFQAMLHYLAAKHAESETRTLLLGLQRRMGCEVVT